MISISKPLFCFFFAPFSLRRNAHSLPSRRLLTSAVTQPSKADAPVRMRKRTWQTDRRSRNACERPFAAAQSQHCRNTFMLRDTQLNSTLFPTEIRMKSCQDICYDVVRQCPVQLDFTHVSFPPPSPCRAHSPVVFSQPFLFSLSTCHIFRFLMFLQMPPPR
jgi:hypothetical protein